jgi:hypothetical protein
MGSQWPTEFSRPYFDLSMVSLLRMESRQSESMREGESRSNSKQRGLLRQVLEDKWEFITPGLLRTQPDQRHEGHRVYTKDKTFSLTGMSVK